MKLTITPEDQALAIRNFISEKYGIYLNIESTELSEVTTDVHPIAKEDLDQVLEDDREWAETRANELGINFRSDIKTSTLITRIAEAEQELREQARNPDPLPMDEPDYEETQYEEVQEEVTEAEEVIEDEPETEEKPVQSKKPSIFDTKR